MRYRRPPMLLCSSVPAGRRQNAGKACGFLQGQISIGPQAAQALYHDALRKGISKRTLERAKGVLGLHRGWATFGCGPGDGAVGGAGDVDGLENVKTPLTGF